MSPQVFARRNAADVCGEDGSIHIFGEERILSTPRGASCSAMVNGMYRSNSLVFEETPNLIVLYYPVGSGGWFVEDCRMFWIDRMGVEGETAVGKEKWGY